MEKGKNGETGLGFVISRAIIERSNVHFISAMIVLACLRVKYNV